MNKYSIMSILMYFVSFTFLYFAGKHLMHTAYADISAIIGLALLLVSAVLSAVSGNVQDNLSPELLDELEAMILERKKNLKD